MNLEAFLLSKTIEADGPLDTPCLIWTAATSRGYARCTRIGMPSQLVHRALWILRLGQIPEDMVLDHLCRNRACCNVAHLELVTIGENIRRGIDARMGSNAGAVCRNGHSLWGKNLRIERVKQWLVRRCKVCANEREKKRYYAKKAITGRWR
jgi:hypothetical protein